VDEPHRLSESEAFKIGKIMFQIGHGDIFVDAMCLEEAVQFVTGFKTKQTQKLGV